MGLRHRSTTKAIGDKINSRLFFIQYHLKLFIYIYIYIYTGLNIVNNDWYEHFLVAVCSLCKLNQLFRTKKIKSRNCWLNSGNQKLLHGTAFIEVRRMLWLIIMEICLTIGIQTFKNITMAAGSITRRIFKTRIHVKLDTAIERERERERGLC